MTTRAADKGFSPLVRWVIAAVVCAQVVGWRSAAAQDLTAGKALYEMRCAQCHGTEGKGDGPAAAFVDPKPRDFTRGQYKFRTTSSGELPTDENLLKVIADGIPGTSMTPFRDALTPQEREHVVAYIKSFYPGFANAKPQEFPLGKTIKGGDDMIAKGAEVYKKMMCFSCHGDAGRGNGASAFTLKDATGEPILPANLHQNWNFRGGGTVRDIYTRLMTGLNGTPMPSYADALESEEDRWALAHYVHSLSRPRNVTNVISAKFKEGDLPTDPKSEDWDAAAWVDVPLAGQVILGDRLFTPSVTQISVKALYNDKEIAFLLYWDDRTNSAGQSPVPGAVVPESSAKGALASGTTAYADAVALQFPVGIPLELEKPYFLGGDAQHPVNLWNWKNGSPVREFNAVSLSSWTAQSEGDQTVRGPGAVFEDGRWWLVVSRSLETPSPETDVQLRAGHFAPVAFFAWDGANGDHGTRCAISTWYDLVLVPGTPARAYALPPVAILLVGGLQFWLVRRAKKKSL
jgi:mono/diheme cytochrome c family protein